MKKLFEQDHDRFDGIRPINIYGMRFIYILMATLLAMDVWTHIITYDQKWDPSDAMNWSVWAAFTLFAVIGIFHTVKMIPIMVLEIVYKTIWLILVALPLFQDGNLSDDTTDGMIFPFILVILPVTFVPWGYVVKKYIKPFN
ncbi:MAG: hypothetical protein P8L24_06765 [Cytophagales bacterium]|nr:hypothetical protein [Cytophagales bacterium]